MSGKESRLLELFFNSPKHWYFNELVAQSKLSRASVSFWLKQFELEGFIKRIKRKGKMPFYVCQTENPKFQNKKKVFAMQQFEESGLLSHLASLDNAAVVIIFGSFSRWDWYKESDIDIFIYGNDKAFEQGVFEMKLKREIEVHTAKNKKELKTMSGMLPYILSGSFVKGSLQQLGVRVHA